MHAVTPDPRLAQRRDALVARLSEVLADDQVIVDDDALAPYESDGLTAYRQRPLAAVLPADTAEVQAVMRICQALGLPIVPRGAGTSLSGGALPQADGVLLGLSKLNRIVEIDYANRVVRAQAGVTNLAITDAVAGAGFYYAPDPSSQIACTIGGNVGENSGGVHCLKYGLTTNNVLGVRLVTATGDCLDIGGRHVDPEGYDLLGVVCGSEGLLGIITEVIVRILPRPETSRALLLGFDDVGAAGACVGGIIGAGIIPAGLEMMDALAIRAAEDFARAGYPTEAAALLIVELDGTEGDVAAEVAAVERIARDSGASVIRASASDEERLTFWAGRKAAFPAVGQISPDYYCMDGTIPRRALPEVLARMAEMSAEYGLRVANVFHAGDGNLHPLILYDANTPGELERAEAFGAEILKLCVEMGGVLTGEHGVGVEKRDLMGEMFDDVDLAHQQRVKCAFDPEGRLNPQKMFPVLHRCAELGRMHVHGGRLPHPDLPRF